MKEIVKRLSEIQCSLVAQKTQKNDFGGYMYRSCEDILTAVKPLLAGEIIIISDVIIQIGERYYVEATASFYNGEETISTTALAREPDTKKGFDEAQLTGSTSSYARKYALNGLLAIDDTADSDRTNKHGKDKEPEDDGEQLSKYTDNIDKLKSADEVISYASDIWDEVKQLVLDGKMSNTDKDKLKSYANQVVDTFNSGR